MSCVSQVSESELRELLKQNHVRVFEIDVSQAVGAKSFFAEAVRVLPQDPPLSGNPNWDAFVDSVWEGLCGLGEQNIAVLWTNCERILHSGLFDLLQASDSFYDLSRRLANPKITTLTVGLRLFLIGNAQTFVL